MKKCEQKKEENMRDVLAWMDARKDTACCVLDKLLTAMSNDEIIGKSNISQIATAFGVVTDKFMTLRTQQEVHPLLKDIAEAMKEKH
nr:MAG TPA: hypothetical protein [Bacteriophage sp.]